MPMQASFLAPCAIRTFADAAEYQAVDQEKWYTPTHPVSGRTVVFDASATKEKSIAPWEVKEAAFKTAFLMGVVHMWDMGLGLGGGYAALQVFLALRFGYTAYGLGSKAVTKVVLLEGGKQVEFTARALGRTTTVNIKDIQKEAHEKTLVETYEESTMFPLNVGGTTYYLNGQSQECVKNGELLRAIINGQSIKM